MTYETWQAGKSLIAKYEEVADKHESYTADMFNVDSNYKEWIVEGVEAKGGVLSLHSALFFRVRILNAWTGPDQDTPLGST